MAHDKPKRIPLADIGPKEARKDVFEIMSEDLPYGAALAMMEEFGLTVEDLEP